MKREADVIVVGSGAGGGTIAKELARAGLDVLILEKGRNHKRFMGTHLSAALMADKLGMSFSREGLQCIRAVTTGGSTMMYCGAFSPPATFIKEELGIDLSAEVEEVRREAGVGKLPDRLLEGCSLMLMEAADKLGYHWEVFDKFVDPLKCRQRCSDCMLGCPTGAKWTARRFVEEAREHGATLINGISVEQVLHNNGRASGVRALRGTELIDFRAPLVILAAGGMGSSPILNRTGIWEAGQGIFVDPLVFVGGVYSGDVPYAGTCYNPTMSVGTWEFHQSEGFMLSPLMDPWIIFMAQMALVSPVKVLKIFHYRRWMSIMVKVKDDMAGELRANGSFSKPLSDSDLAKIDRGVQVSKEILFKTGCREKSVVRGPIRGAHPGGACRIGEVVDINLQSRHIENLYVSDASVFPQSLGTPVVATVAAMNKRLAKHLLKTREAR
jgi:choline dehydrogenase-like flavoprotein